MKKETKKEREVKNCQHEHTSLVQIMYSNPDTDCEFTLRCNDCQKVLGYHTNTFEVRPILI